MLKWFFLMVGLALIIKSIAALKTGRIYVGWAFGEVSATRGGKDAFMYWYMLVFGAAAGVIALGVAACKFILPTT